MSRGTLKLLGIAFLIQAIGSFVSGAILLEPLIVQDSIVETMTNMAGNVFRVRANIVGEMITACGIIMLGSLLYRVLRKHGENISLIAFGLYVAEAVILAVSRIGTFMLLRVSQESVLAGHPDHLLALGELCLEFQESGYSLLMLPFAIGATMFYLLFYKSGIIPRSLNYLGLFAAPMSVVGTLLALFNVEVPLILYVVMFFPNLPFELGTGLWLLVKSGKDSSDSTLMP